jgi:uncharacterized protein
MNNNIEDGKMWRVVEYHIIDSVKSKYVLFDVKRFLIFEIDKDTKDVLSFIESHDEVSPEIIHKEFDSILGESNVSEVVDSLISFGILRNDDKYIHDPDFTKMRKAPESFCPHNIVLNISHACNISCIYCYGDEGSFGSKDSLMSLEVAKDAVDWYIEGLKIADIKSGNIGFFGGEPLMNFRIIEPVVKYANSLAKKDDLNITYSMTTNGTLITDDVAKKLAELNVNIMVSIDGGSEIQNKQRPLRSGGDSFKKTVAGARNFMKHAKRRISARATFINTDLLKVTKDLYNAGFGNVYLSPCTGRLGDHLRTKKGSNAIIQAFKELYDFYVSVLIKSYNRNIDNFRFPRGAKFVQTLRELVARKPRFWVCGAGRSYVAISPHGDIYLCHRFVGDADYKMSSIYDGHDRNHWYNEITEYSATRKGKCKTCWVRYSCAGGCFHNNLVESGDIYQSSFFDCEQEKKLTELVITYFHELRINYPEMLKKLCGLEELPEHETV